MEFNAVQLYYEECGDGIPVLLLHGFPFDHTIWDAVIPLLKPHARLILPDLRGHGKSPAPEGVYSMRLMAEDIAALLDRLQIDRAILVGHSMGGYVSLAFAQAYPNQLMGLGLVATQAAADTLEKRQARLVIAEEIHRRGVKHLAVNMTPKLTGNAELYGHIQGMILKMSSTGIVGAEKGMADRPDMTDFLSFITVPSLVIAGAADEIVPLERAQAMSKMLARAWLVEVPGSKHLPMLENPSLVAEALRQLIEGVKGYK
jgi:3-oxoadipate enol-lactonase